MFTNAWCYKILHAWKNFSKCEIHQWIVHLIKSKSSLMWFQTPHCSQSLKNYHLSSSGVQSKKNIHSYLKRVLKYCTPSNHMSVWSRTSFTCFSQSNIVQHNECRNIWENPIIFIKSNIKDLCKNVKQCHSSLFLMVWINCYFFMKT